METGERIDRMLYTARWAVEAEVCVTHRVDYRLLDQEFDAASDSMILWRGCCEELGGWPNRVPPSKEAGIPMVREPVMEVLAESVDCRRIVADVIDNGRIICRHQIFEMPTIERERIIKSRLDERMPSLDMAFRLT